MKPKEEGPPSLLFRIPFLRCLCLYFCFSFSSAFAQVGSGLPHYRQPPLVRIQGVLAIPTNQQRDNLKTVSVHVKGKTWKLRINEITSLTASTTTGWSLLNDLFPRKLHLIGPDELLLPLQHDDIAGKPLELEGRLYVGEHQLLLSDVNVKESE
jgi:hypothetical protein